MMRGKALVVNPETARIQVTVEMSYTDARALLEQLPDNRHPGWEFRSLLRGVLEETIEHISTAREVET